MNIEMNGRPILLGSILLLLSLSSVAILRALSTSSLTPTVGGFGPSLNYLEVNGDSQVTATIVHGDGCFQVTSWKAPVQSGNEFSVNASIVDYDGPGTACTAVMLTLQHSYMLGQLDAGNYSFTFSACVTYPNQGGVVDCTSYKAKILFQTIGSNFKPLPPTGSKIMLQYQEVNGISFVNATIVVPPCFRMRGWSEASQSGNSFRSNVTIVDDERLMIACIAIDTLAHNSYNLGHLPPGSYSFTLYLCEAVIGWGTTGTTGTSISTDCSNTSTVFFAVPGTPVPQPSPPNDWFRIFGPFAIIIIILLRLLGFR